MTKPAYRLVAGLCFFFAVNLPATASVTQEKDWRFRVFLDDREIGYHHFHLIRNGTTEQLTTEARLKVSFLKIPLFKYRHNNVEVWHGECLKNITSATVENGRNFKVEGAAYDGDFQLTTDKGEKTLPACISTFAYWDKSFLERNRLLNSQTGEYIDVESEYLGENSIDVRNKNIPAHHYQLITDEASIQLWYSQDDGQWLALESTVASGYKLRYIIE